MVSTIRGDDGFDSAQYVNLLNTYAGRNKVINSDFDIWQRGLGPFTFGYTADRWNIGLVGATFTISRSQPSQIIQDGNTTRNVVLAITSGSVDAATTVTLLKQKIEDVRTLAGQTVTLTFWASSTAGSKVGVGIKQVFGTGGSTTVLIDGQATEDLPASRTKQTMTFTIPSVEGKTIGTDSCLHLSFFFSTGSNYDTEAGSIGIQDDSWYLSQVQLETGDTPTVYEIKTYGQHLAECQRYYQAVYYSFQASTGGHMPANVQFPPMRATPDVNAYSMNGVLNRVSALSSESVAVGTVTVQPRVTYSSMRYIGVSGLTDGTGYAGYVLLDAEL